MTGRLVSDSRVRRPAFLRVRSTRLMADIDWSPNGFYRFTGGYEFEQENFRNDGSTPSGTGDFFTDASQSSHAFYAQHLVRFFDGRLQFAGGFRAQVFRLGSPRFSLTNALVFKFAA